MSNIWTTQENLIHFYKMVSLGLAGLAIVILVFTVMAYFRDPIVVVRQGASQEFYATGRSSVTIEKQDVEEFVRDYLKAFYVWESFDPKKVGDEVRPYSEEALVPKIIDNQMQKFGKLKEKKLSQDVAFVNVKVLDNRVVCSFLRVLKIEGIPLVVPTELSFSLIEGTRTRANPIGIYVAGISESEREK